MPTRIAMGVAALVVFLLLIVLYLQVRGGPVKPSVAELEAARGKGARVAAANAGESAGRSSARRARGVDGIEDPWQRPAPAEDVEKPTPSRSRPLSDDDEPQTMPAPELMMPPVPEGVDVTPPGDLDHEMTLSERLAEANRLYDKKEYEEAEKLALELLADDPENSRMLRVVVSSACAMGDEAKAREFHAKMRPRDKAQMATRCEKFSIKLPAQ